LIPASTTNLNRSESLPGRIRPHRNCLWAVLVVSDRVSETASDRLGRLDWAVASRRPAERPTRRSGVTAGSLGSGCTQSQCRGAGGQDSAQTLAPGLDDIRRPLERFSGSESQVQDWQFNLCTERHFRVTGQTGPGSDLGLALPLAAESVHPGHGAEDRGSSF
jgi:hypothetical protein